MSDEKATQRAAVRTRLRTLDADARRARSAAICSEIESSAVFGRASMVIGYSALPDEPDVAPLLARAAAVGKAIALPRVESDEAMTFRRVLRPGDDLAQGRWGLREPGGDAEVIRRPSADALVLVPGVVFDAAGGRVGRGKGYYDRALSADGWGDAVTVGVCFAVQVVERVPREEHDRGVDMIADELGIRDAGRRGVG